MLDDLVQKHIILPIITWVREKCDPIIGPDDISPFPHFQPDEHWYDDLLQHTSIGKTPAFQLPCLENKALLLRGLFWDYRPGKAMVFLFLLLMISFVLMIFVNQGFLWVYITFLFLFALATGEAYDNAKNILQAIGDSLISKKALLKSFEKTENYFDFQHYYYNYFYKHRVRDSIYNIGVVCIWVLLLGCLVALCIMGV